MVETRVMSSLDSFRVTRSLVRRVLPLAAAALLALGVAAACGGDGPADAEPEPLKIGLLMSFSGPSSDRSAWRERGFLLAIKHVNDAGGVFGLDVETARGDTGTDSETAVAEARRLVEAEGVHAIVGPSSSANSLPVAELVTGPAGVVNISPSASSPQLTNADDDGFFFRIVLADTAQGPVLARVTRERGFDNVGVMYQDDAYGRGLAESFAAAWTGRVSLAAVERGQDSYMAALAETAEDGAQALLIIASGPDAETMVRESLESGLYDSFTFGDAARSPNLVRNIGGDRLGGMYGTAGVSAPGSESSAAWERAFLDEHGELPAFAYVKETYDAVIAIALAAEAAGVTDGAATRDRLRAVASAPGEVALAGPEGVAEALRIVRDGGDVDYEGAAATLDWDANGDLVHGHVGVWRYTADERIEDVEAVPIDFGSPQ